MSQEPAADASQPLVQPIRTTAPERSYPFRSPTALTYAVTLCVGINTLVLVANSAALTLRLQLLGKMTSGGFASQAAVLQAAQASDRVVQVVAILLVASVIAAYVAGGMWIYRAASNARGLGARGLHDSPGWAVGWYFIPVASLFRPFAAMEQLYKASFAPIGWQSKPTPTLLRAWWAAWLIAGYYGYIVTFVARNNTSIAGLRLVTMLQIVESGLDFLAIGLFLTIVWRVYRAQLVSKRQAAGVADVFT